MNFPSGSFVFPVFPAIKHTPPENGTAPSEYEDQKSPEMPTTRSQRVSKIIETQASRVVHDTGDAVELKPITVESQPPTNVRRFLEVAAPQITRGRVIDTYA